MPKLSDKEYESIINDYLSGMTQNETGIKNGIGRDAVGKILKRFGVETRDYTGERDASRKWEWNYDFFKYETPEVAYWSGFLIADGNIDKAGDTITLVIQSKDVEHLYAYCDSIGINRDAVYKTKNYNAYGVNAHKKGIYSDLKTWGVTPRKSKNFVRPYDMPLELVPHFLRGWIDGDGSVYRYGRAARISVASGNKQSLRYFSFLLRSIGYIGNIGIKETSSKAYPGNYYLYIGGANQVSDVANLLLVDKSFCLERKWNKIYEGKRSFVKRNCEMCGKEFDLDAYRAKNEPQNGRFCSKECFDDYQRL